MALNVGDRVGIIGGGQLGRMMAMAAAQLGLKVTVLDPASNAPAFEVADQRIVAPYTDPAALSKMASECAVITYEFENIDVAAVETLETISTCHPNSKALAVSQDRLTEKKFFSDIGAKTAGFHPVSTPKELTHALQQTGGNGILKTRRFGYDGKGQVRISNSDPQAIANAETVLMESACILEAFVDFERELSIVAARSSHGDIVCFDLAENVHREGILRTSTVPAIANNAQIKHAEELATRLLEALDYVGVLAIEFFVTREGELIVNEFAPRVHNSGHWTEAACCVSQFEQHIRAVAGLPLAETTRHSDCIMENLIGPDIEKTPDILARPQTKLHLYGKAEMREGRKMGHFTQIKPKS
jgi:5-(carboxyamino)imidazole ribonucleotide synthase